MARRGLARFFELLRRSYEYSDRLNALELELDMLRSYLELGRDAYDEFQTVRKSAAYQAVFDEPEPLVTVCVGTYNRAGLLTERSLPSILGQSYRNIQVIVVGDGCTDDTAKHMAGIRDSRVSFINLSQRGQYPEGLWRQWRVAGTAPVNHALGLAEGAFITHLDDDDMYFPDRIERLVALARERRADIVTHPFYAEREDGSWFVVPAHDFVRGQATTSSMFYHQWFRRFPWDVGAHLLMEPGDWNRLRKFKYLGAVVARYPEPLIRHFRERHQRKNGD